MSTLRDRIIKQFRRSVIYGLGVIATLAITPLAIARFVQGDVLIGSIDVVIMLAIWTMMLGLYRGVAPERIGTVCALVVSVSAGAITWLDLERGVMWTYSVIIANFMLTSHGRATVISSLLAGTFIARPDAFPNLTGYLGFVMTTLMVMGFAGIFAWRTNLLAEELEKLAMRDALTGLRNRRALIQRMQDIIGHARPGARYGLMLLDLDHFKRVNDTWGHEFGDNVLRDFAQLVERHVRSGDELFRHGGEEFVLLLPRADLADVTVVADHLLQVVRDGLRVCGQPVTVSIGASVLQHGETSDTWLSRCDALMYEAKRGGRDRAVVAATVPPQRAPVPPVTAPQHVGA